VTRCHRCGATSATERVGVREVCTACGAFLHCCRNCDFYSPGLHNDCRELNAERVADKEHANFCDYFRPVAGTAPARTDDPAGTRARLDALFRRKS